MKQFNKVTIIGVGLIGGSIGLAVKAKKMAKKVVGVCRHKESLQKALRRQVIDEGNLNYKDAVKDADLVILATPVEQIIKIGKEIAPYLKKGSLVTDVGSTKLAIVRSMEKALPAGFCFVGAHPMAGSEKRGVDQARRDLFQGALCILTRTARTNAAALRKMAAFWRRMGSRTVVFSPTEHDRVVALISHLPHLAAAQLVNVAGSSLSFASSGFFDTTRIASSSAEIWTDIFLSNKKFLTRAIDKYIDNLQAMRRSIDRGDRRRLSVEFKKVKKLRDSLLHTKYQ